MNRFFVQPEVLRHNPVVLTGAQAHQIQRVLRLRPGERVTLLDGRGRAYEAALMAYAGDEVRFETVRDWVATGEPRTHLTLYQAVLKGERFAWALQKGTEVGISRLVPVVCERNVAGDLEAIEQKRGRWERILQEAAEQSRRARVPELAPARTFTEAVTEEGQNPTLRLIPWEETADVTLRAALGQCNLEEQQRIQVVVGPEGGFTAGEVQLARRHGWLPVSLGPRILRAETAGIVAATAILYGLDDLDPAPREHDRAGL